MASKIDSSEGSFMAELEGMESKRLEAATDYAGKLEDKYVRGPAWVWVVGGGVELIWYIGRREEI